MAVLGDACSGDDECGRTHDNRTKGCGRGGAANGHACRARRGTLETKVGAHGRCFPALTMRGARAFALAAATIAATPGPIRKRTEGERDWWEQGHKQNIDFLLCDGVRRSRAMVERVLQQWGR